MALLGKFSVKNFKSSLFASNNNAIVHNRFVLYFIFLISLGNLFYMSMDGDVFSIILFALIGYLTSFFSKNMIIILFAALTFTNILKYGANITKEGAKNMNDDEEEGAEKSSDAKKETMEDGEDKDKKVKDTAETFEKMKQLADILGTK